MPKAKLARLCYNMTKAKLPRLKTVRQRRNFLDTMRQRRLTSRPLVKRKRKFSRKQLAAQRLFAKRAKAGTLRKRRR